MILLTLALCLWNRRTEFVRTIFKLGTMISIVAETTFVKFAEVNIWSITFSLAQVADKFPTTLSELEMRIDVSFTSRTAEGTLLISVGKRRLCHTRFYFLRSQLGKGLN